jgi:spermidine synthase
MIKTHPNRLLFIYFGSGFAALLYQIIWQRWLVFYTGMSTESVSLIVSAFMAGLGLGYLWGGWVADRATQRQNLRYFVLAEVGIGLFALVSKYFIYDYLYQQSGLQTSSLGQTYLVLFGVLLLPTCLMGFSLPVLSKAIVWENVAEQARYIGRLYFINTLGAAFGAWITGVWLVRQLGFEHSVWVGAIVNFACAVGGYWVLNRGVNPLSTNTKPQTVNHQRENFTWAPTFIAWAGQYAWSGFAAISLELIWFRVLELMVKSVSVTFAILLGIYLSGLALGTYTGARWRPSVAQAKAWFWWGQAGIYIYTALSFLLLLFGLQHFSFLEIIRAYLERYEPTWSFQSRLVIYGALPLFLLWLPTFLMGVSFSLSQVLVQDSPDEVGRRVGWLQFANIVGSTFGAWTVAFVGFETLGTATTLKVVLLLGGVYLLVLHRAFWQNQWGRVAIALTLVTGLTLLLPSNFRFWRVFNGLKEDSQFFYDEDRTGLSVIKTHQNGSETEGIVFANGLGQSKLPFYTDPVHVALGLIPTVLHPAPKQLAVIGLGSGGTLLGVCGRINEAQRIDCFELMANQGKVLETYAQKADMKVVGALLHHPRIYFHWRDGRYALRSNPQRYDLIEADALRPTSAYAGNLYSKAYFQLLQSRLNAGGFAVSWHATERTRLTMMSVFRYVYGNELILIGTDQPIDFQKSIDQKLSALEQNTLFKAAKIDPVSVVKKELKTFQTYQAGHVSSQPDFNTDLFPKDEFAY